MTERLNDEERKISPEMEDILEELIRQPGIEQTATEGLKAGFEKLREQRRREARG